jgi:hypothetical protein
MDIDGEGTRSVGWNDRQKKTRWGGGLKGIKGVTLR